ncbi:MAG TPA: carbohydrate kinase [Coleofasciculaceae cyanobacterium]
MTDPRVLCLGEILWDYLADQPAPAVEQVTSWTRYAGGAPANVACALTKLGTPAGLIACVGEDQSGELLIQLLQTVGVDRRGVQRHALNPTRMVEVLRNAAGDRQFAGFGGRAPDQFADAYLQADLVPEQLFEAADFLVLGTLGLAYPDSKAAIAHALDLATQHSLKVLVDVNWRPMFWLNPAAAKPMILELIQQVNFLKLSVEEAEWLFDLTDAAAIAHQLQHLEGVLITAGDQGCTYDLGGHTGRVPAFAVEVEDTTGAGDSFVAGFIHQCCQRGIAALNDPQAAQQMVIYASAVGALTTIRAGAIDAQPTAAEVEAFIYLNPVSMAT